MPFDTVSTARAVVLGTETQFSGTVNPASPFAYYRIDVKGRSSLRVSLTALSGNANLEIVRDINGNGTIENAEILHRSTNGGAIAEALSPILDAGTYFVRVAATTDSTNYQLSISASSNRSNEFLAEYPHRRERIAVSQWHFCCMGSVHHAGI